MQIHTIPLKRVLHLQVFAELEAIVDRLATDSQRASYSMKRLPSPKSALNHTGVKLVNEFISRESIVLSRYCYNTLVNLQINESYFFAHVYEW